MWNNLYIKPPPTNSFLGKPNSVDTKTLSSSLQKFIEEVQKCKKNLHIEAAILSRLIYRLKQKFRKDKGMKAMLKIKASLYKYLKLNILDDIKRFLKSIPTSTKQDVYYPTKQMLEFIMVRIQSFSKLMVRIVNISMELCQFCINRMKLGHFWNIALLTLAISSRIGGLSQHLIEASCICYDKLHPIRNQLEYYGAKWLEPDYELPEVLHNWLDLTWSPEDLKLIAERRLEMPIMIIDDDDDDDVQFCYEYKNDYIVIDDTIKIAEDDVQFVEEYIDLITKMNPKMRNQNVTESVIEVSSDKDSSDVEIVTDLSELMCDIGEKIARDKIESDIGEKIERNVIDLDTTLTSDLETNQEGDTSIDTVNNTVINVITPSSSDKKRRKRKRKNKQEIEIQNKVIEHIQNSPSKSSDLIMLSTFGTPMPISDEVSSPVSKKPNNSIIEIESDSSMMENSSPGFILSSVNDINNLLHDELKNRKIGKPRFSKHLNKKKWNELIKRIGDVMSKRKSMKQSKKEVVETVKNILKSYIDL